MAAGSGTRCGLVPAPVGSGSLAGRCVSLVACRSLRSGNRLVPTTWSLVYLRMPSAPWRTPRPAHALHGVVGIDEQGGGEEAAGSGRCAASDEYACAFLHGVVDVVFDGVNRGGKVMAPTSTLPGPAGLPDTGGRAKNSARDRASSTAQPGCACRPAIAWAPSCAAASETLPITSPVAGLSPAMRGARRSAACSEGSHLGPENCRRNIDFGSLGMRRSLVQVK